MLCWVHKHGLAWPRAPCEPREQLSPGREDQCLLTLSEGNQGHLCLPPASPASSVAAGLALQPAGLASLAPNLFLCLQSYSRGWNWAWFSHSKGECFSSLAFSISHSHVLQRTIKPREKSGCRANLHDQLRRSNFHLGLERNATQWAKTVKRVPGLLLDRAARFRDHIQPLQSATTQCLSLKSHSCEKGTALMRAKSTGGTFQACNTSS